MAGTANIVVRGNVTEALAALRQLGLEAELQGKKTEAAFGDRLAGTAERTGGVFARLGQTMTSWGVPFGASMTHAGDRIAEADTKGKKFGQSMQEVGKVALFGVAGAAVTVGVESIKMADNFQQSTANMAAKANIGVGAAQQIGKAFLSTSGQTTFSAQQMEQAYGDVAGQLAAVSGKALDSKQALAVMKAATDLAEGSATDLGTSTAALAQTMQAYHIGADGAADASNVLFNTSRLTGNGVDQVALAASRLKMRLGDAAPPLDQVGGLMVEMANNGVTGSRAVTMVGSSLAGMVFPSTAAKKTLGEMGVNLADANGKFIGLAPAVDALRAGFMKLPGATGAAAAAQQLAADKVTLARLALEKQTPAVKAQEAALKAHDVTLQTQAQALSDTSAAQALFGKNAATLMPIVMGGSAALDQQTKVVAKVGSAHAAADKQAQTFHGTIEKLKATGEDLGVSFGLVLIPKLEELAKDTASVVNWFEKHKAVAEALAGVIGGVLSVAVAAFTVNKLAGMVRGIGEASKTLKTLGSDAAGVAQKLLGLQGTAGQTGKAAGTALSEVNTAGATAATELEGAGTKAAGSIEAGAATAEAEMAAGGATAETELAAGGATAEAEEAAGGATADAEMGAGGRGGGAAGMLGKAGLVAGAGVAAYMGTTMLLHHTAAGKAVGAASGAAANFFGVGPQQTYDRNIGKKLSGEAGEITMLEAWAKAPKTARFGQGKDISPGDAKKMLHNLGVKGYALGGAIAAGQWAMVGESGPEVARFNLPATIYPNSGSASGANRLGGMGGPVNINIENLALPGVTDPNQFAAQMAQRARLEALAGGSARSRS